MTVYEPPPKFKPAGAIEYLLSTLMGPVRTAYATIGDSMTSAAFVLVVGSMTGVAAYEAWNLPMHEARVRQQEAFAERSELGAELDRLRVVEKQAQLEALGIDTWTPPE